MRLIIQGFAILRMSLISNTLIKIPLRLSWILSGIILKNYFIPVDLSSLSLLMNIKKGERPNSSSRISSRLPRSTLNQTHTYIPIHSHRLRDVGDKRNHDHPYQKKNYKKSSCLISISIILFIHLCRKEGRERDRGEGPLT
jgi:hypothetical protein